MEPEKPESSPTTTPVPFPFSFSNVARSGTFIIEPTEKKRKSEENGISSSTKSQDFQSLEPTSPPANDEKETTAGRHSDNGDNNHRPSEMANANAAGSSNNQETESSETDKESERKSQTPVSMLESCSAEEDVSERKREREQAESEEPSSEPTSELPKPEARRRRFKSPPPPKATPTPTSAPLIPTPEPEPRKTLVKSQHGGKGEESPCKYLVLREKLRQRWGSVAKVPKTIQMPIDPIERKILQDQLARRLQTRLIQETEDFQILKRQAEEALRCFYSQEQQKMENKPTDSVKITNVNDLPSLTFLQWMIPALDNESANLLFGC